MTGAAVATFAAFEELGVSVAPELAEVTHVPGVARRFCRECGSALTARFDYLEGQVYVPVGVLNDAGDFQPERHCHADAMLPWLRMDDDLPREIGSARASISRASR